MKIPITALFLVLGATLAHAQSADEVELRIGAFELAANGAEKASGGWRTTGPVSEQIGKPTVGVFSMHGCGYFAITVPPNTFEDKATAGWRVEVTPTRVVNHVVTFRLRWVRALDPDALLAKGPGLTQRGEDLEVTLRPGESRPIDSAPVPAGASTFDGRPCATKAMSLRVVADFPDLDRRLIGVDAWLVERLPSGKEESQLQSLRGLPHRPIAFYFDGVSDGGKRYDFFGKLLVDPQQGRMEIEVEAIRGAAATGEHGYQAARWFKSTIQLKADEIVEVALPPDDKTDPLANRVFAIRLRTKQLR